jgi:hypothetical protein
MPSKAQGVNVKLSVFDPNKNTYVIGTATSNINGNYAFAWTPPVPGVYTITATFEGSGSYFASTEDTHIAVSTSGGSVPSPSGSPSPSEAPSPGSGALPTTYIAIAAAVIVIVAVAAALVLRRRK